jgi:hypothetical protein
MTGARVSARSNETLCHISLYPFTRLTPSCKTCSMRLAVQHAQEPYGGDDGGHGGVFNSPDF